jgi:hypothetical protein
MKRRSAKIRVGVSGVRSHCNVTLFVCLSYIVEDVGKSRRLYELGRDKLH